jgi:uncharacterized delta-60 repeat protein
MNIRSKKLISVAEILLGLFVLFGIMGTLKPAYAVDTILDPGFNATSSHPGVTYYANSLTAAITDKTAANAVAFYPAAHATNGGKTVTAGTYDSGIVVNGVKLTEIIVIRYNTDGTFDKQFRYYDSKLQDSYAANAVSIQPDGKIVVVGTVNIGGFTKLCMLRLTDDTASQITFDQSFGNPLSRGWFVYPDENNFNYKGNSVALQADGKIVVAGVVNMGGNDHLWVARFLADGSNIDPGFVFRGDIGYTFGAANAVAVQADQKIVVVGTYNDNFIDYTNPLNPVTAFTGNSYAWVIRLDSTGAEDVCGFNNSSVLPACTGGDLLLGSTVPGVYTGTAIAIDPVSQKIVVAGTSFGSKARVFQLTPSGALDPVFNPDSVNPVKYGIIDFQGAIATYGNAVAIQSDGKIVLAGTDYNDIAGANSSVFLARMNNSGDLTNNTLLDRDFNFGSYDFMFGGTGKFAGRAVAIQADDKIVVAGTGDASQFFLGSTSLLTIRLQPTYKLAVNIVGGGVVNVAPGALTNGISYYIAGDSVQLTAVPYPGYSFSGWKGACTGNYACHIKMDSAKNVTASFQLAATLPSITSPSSSTFTFSSLKVFTVSATGIPQPALSNTGTLPSGITFVDNGNGTATISGTPAAGSVGSYPISITATNADGSTRQAFTLTVSKATASVTLGNLSAIYDGNPKSVTASTVPVGLATDITYNGSGPAPTNAGTYPVTATINDSNYHGTASGTLTIAKAPQTFTFAPTATKTYGDADFGPGATIDTGLPITYESSNPALATITTEGLVHIVSAGTVTITAHQAGDSNHLPGSAAQTLTINKAQIQVTADNKNRNYGAPDPLFTASYSGFVKGETATVIHGTPTFTTTATATSIAGSYTITPDISGLTADNYSFTAAPGTLAIDVASQTITFNPLTARSFGDAPFTLSASGGSSNNPISYISSDTTVATIDGNTVTIVSAGSTTITASQAGIAGEYASATSQQNLTVNKGVITVTADNKQRPFNTTNPTFFASFTGFAYSDTQTVINGSPTFSTPATPTSDTGSYPIIPDVTGLTAANYTFTAANGTLGVNVASQTIILEPLATKTYGDTPFDLTATGGPSNNTIAFESSNPAVATINGTTVTIKAAGSAVITANQAGNHNYASATAQQTMTVNKALLTVTAENKQREYNSADPAFTATYSGFVNSDGQTALQGIPSLSSSATLTSSVGDYPIIPGVGNLFSNNYSFEYLPGILTIIKAVPVITWSSPEPISYGTALSELQLSAAANVPGTYTYTPPLGSTPATGTIDVTLQFTPADTVNYAPKTLTSTLTITKSTPVLTWATPASIVYGTALSETQLNATANVAGSIVYTPPSGTVLNAGTAILTATFTPNDALNYTGQSATVSLTITKADQTITAFAPPTTATYGDIPITLSATGGQSGTSVTLSVTSGPGSITGNQLTITGAGTINLNASQAGSSNYNPAQDVTASIIVAPKPLTITAGNAGRAYGDPNPIVTAFTATGLVGSDSIGSVTNAIAASATPTAAPGSSHAITPTAYLFSNGSANNYNITYIAGTLSIQPDTTAPTVSVFALPSIGKNTTVSFSTLSAGDNVAITGWCLVETGNLTDCTWTDTKPSGYTFDSAGSKTLTVFTRDAAGNISDPVSASTIIDTTQPQAAITAPLNTQSVLDLITIAGTASDNTGVTGVELQVSSTVPPGVTYYLHADSRFYTSAAWLPASGTTNWSLDTFNVTFTDGRTYTITARATDSAGNVSPSVTTTFKKVFVLSPDYTTLTLDLSAATILQGQTVGVSGRLTRLPNNGMNMTGNQIAITVTSPTGQQSSYTTTTSTSGDFSLPAVTGFSGKGIYTISANFSGTGTLAPSSAVAKTLLVGSQAGYALLVQGKITNGEGLADHNKSTNKIYTALKERGFLDENIIYLNYNTNQPGVDGLPSKAAIQSALGSLASAMNLSPAPLYIALVDHGNKDEFYLDTETITPTELNTWLTTMEGTLNPAALAEKRIIVIGSCYSGSFIKKLSKTGRIIITSAADDELSARGSIESDGIRSGEYFLDELFTGFSRGDNIHDAYKSASEKARDRASDGMLSNSISRYGDRSKQHPQIDLDGDGKGNFVEDQESNYSQLASLYLGAGVSYAFNSANNPAEFTNVTGTLILGSSANSATLWGIPNKQSEFAGAWVEIRSPGYLLNSYSGTGQRIINLPRYAMTYNDITQRYELDYSNFSEVGPYEILYYASDIQTGVTAPMLRSIVYKQKTDNLPPSTVTLISPVNGSTEKSMTVFEWTIATDPENNPLSYTLEISPQSDFSTTAYKAENLLAPSAFVPAGILKDLTNYTWRVTVIDLYGAASTSAPSTFSTNNSTGLPGIISGYVINEQTGLPISSASISINSGQAKAVYANGSYIVQTNPGAITLTVRANGYADKTTNLTVGTGATITAMIALTPTDVTAPVIGTFSIPATSPTATVAINILSATDNVGVTGYCIQETDSPLNCSWSTDSPASHTFTTPGPKTLYAFAIDGQNNISSSKPAQTIIGNQLTVTISGSGSVNGDFACMTPSCSDWYLGTTAFALSAFGTSTTVFGGWTGNCTTVDGVHCSVTLNTSKTVTATFLDADKIRTGKPPYATVTPYLILTDAFTAVLADETVQARAIVFDGPFTVSRPVTFKGGFNVDFSDNSGNYTVLKGRVSVGTGGRLNVGGVKVRPMVP